MGLKYIANVFMNIFQPKERKEQQEIISDGHIIYQSDGNSETVDHVEARDQPKSFRTTILQFRSTIQSLWSSLPSFYKLPISMFG
ncbi:hypothetical protein Bca101_033969 [Brassica carinata]